MRTAVPADKLCSYTTRGGQPCKAAAEQRPDGVGARACHSHWCSLPGPRNKCVYPPCVYAAYTRERYGGAPMCDGCYGIKSRMRSVGPYDTYSDPRLAWWAAWEEPLSNPDTARGMRQQQWKSFRSWGSSFFSSGSRGSPHGGAGGASSRGASAPPHAAKPTAAAPHEEAAPPRVPPPSAADYALLGVSATARASEVRRAFLQLAKVYHPDANPSASAKVRFQEVHAAYERVFHRART